MNTVQIELPQAFSVRDVHEFTAHNHLLARLRVKPVAVGIHVNGGPTVYPFRRRKPLHSEGMFAL